MKTTTRKKIDFESALMLIQALIEGDSEKALPATIGPAADLVYRVRERRLQLGRVVEKLQEFQDTLEEHTIALLDSQGLESGRGLTATVSKIHQDIPTIEDWDRFVKYMARTHNFNLIQKRIATTAVKELIEDGKAIPGVEMIHPTKLSITKITQAPKSNSNKKKGGGK